MIERGAPHLIRTEEQLAAYTKALYRLTAEPHPTPTQVEAIELLTLLIERFEEEQYALPTASPASVLRFLLAQHGLKQRDIAPDLGGESVVSEVLSGKRKLNATHIEQLSRRFHVSPAVFFPAA
jgi:HTH-type transcriptional regulator/antitoxin HigA